VRTPPCLSEAVRRVVGVAVVATAAAVARRQPHLVCGLERGKKVVAVGEHACVWGKGAVFTHNLVSTTG
jgi:hypothetical protein